MQYKDFPLPYKNIARLCCEVIKCYRILSIGAFEGSWYDLTSNKHICGFKTLILNSTNINILTCQTNKSQIYDVSIYDVFGNTEG